MKELFFLVTVPWTFTLYCYPLLKRNYFFDRLPFLLKLCLSLSCGSSILLIVLSLFGYFSPIGFAIFAKIFFIISFLSCLAILISRGSAVKKISQGLVKIKKKDIIFFFPVIILISLHLLIFLLKPVIDSDVIETYLPFARSIIIYDKIPSHSYYDGRSFIIPPIGAPVIYAYFYALSGTLLSESFKLVNVPFFMGIIGFSYFIFQDFLKRRKAAVLTLFILLSFPLIEDLVFNASLYPDFIFSFLAISSFWIVSQLYLEKRKSDKKLLFFILGLSVASSILLKYQGFFLFSIIILLLFLPFARRYYRFLLLPLVYLPLITGIVTRSNPFPLQSNFHYLIFLILPAAVFSFSRLTLTKKQKISIWVLLVFIMTIVGFLPHLNQYFRSGVFNEITEERKWMWHIQSKLESVPNPPSIIEIWSLFLAPSMGIYFLLPKIIGFLQSIRNRRMTIPLLITFLWYSWWVLMLGSSDVRWLMPILPFIAIFVYLGLEKIFVFLTAVRSAIITSIFFMILSSKFIFWNLGVLFLQQPVFRKTVAEVENVRESFDTVITHKELFTHDFASKIRTYVLENLFILTARVPHQNRDLGAIFIMSICFFLGIFIFSKLMVKKKLLFAPLILLVILYVVVIIGISEGKIANFAEKEQNKIFHYWGQSTVVVPYLKKHAKADDKVVIYSLPSGLSYYTNLKVYNLEYGGGLSLFYPIANETDINNIYQFYKKNKIRFVVIREYQDSKVKFQKLRQSTQIFNILDDNKYAKLVIYPDGNSFWRIFEII